MSSLNPARKYGFEKEKGSIKIGKDSDFVVIDDDYQVIETYCQEIKYTILKIIKYCITKILSEVVN